MKLQSASGRGMTNPRTEERRDAHHMLLDFDAIGESPMRERAADYFITKHGAALRAIIAKAAGL
jgi:hypothetical protein